MFDMLLLIVGLAILAGLIFIGVLVTRKLLGYPMLKAPSDQPRTNLRFFDSLTSRVVLIAILALLMLIPLSFVGEIVSERSQRHGEVLNDIATTWGQSQTVAGPVLIIPFTEAVIVEDEVVDEEGRTQITRRTVRSLQNAHFLPRELAIEATLTDEVRQRGLFKSLVYDADAQLDASFEPVDIISLSDDIETIHWDKAWISIGLSDTRAIAEVSRFEWNGAEQVLSPGTRFKSLPSGFHAELRDVETNEGFTLALNMRTKGSGAFQFTPFGTTTQVTLRSKWPHPSFLGSALPDTREISADGFVARWEIPHLARNYPQAWHEREMRQDLFEFTAGVTLFEPVSLYSQVTRAVKYGLLFIGLTYLTLLVFEITLKRTLHPVQYALVGVALSVFFLVLLALSEHMAFLSAYALATALTVLMIAFYVATVLRSLMRGGGVAIMLIALYAILYSLLQLEDYALLLGTGLLVAVIMVLMLVTRNLQRENALVTAPGEK